MALPTTRNTTYAPGSQVKSADLNALQDQWVALTGGAGMAQTLKASAAIMTTGDLTVTAGDAVLTAGDLHLTAGDIRYNVKRSRPLGAFHFHRSVEADWDISGAYWVTSASSGVRTLLGSVPVEEGDQIVGFSVALELGSAADGMSITLEKSAFIGGGSVVQTINAAAATGVQVIVSPAMTETVTGSEGYQFVITTSGTAALKTLRYVVVDVKRPF